MEAAPAVAPTRRPPWMWPSVAVGVLMLGLLAAWMGGVFKVKTPDGVIVLENVPKDSEILVDGDKFTFTWPGSGKPVEIRAVPGQHKVEVKKDGFKTFGETVTVKTDESEEVTVHLEPLVVDRREDKRPKNVLADAVRFGKKWYKLYCGAVTWNEAKKKCQELGGQLVTVESEQENSFLRSLLLRSRIDFVWLGATDEVTEGNWIWVNGMQMQYTRWDIRQGQPNNWAGNGIPEHYAAMDINSLWWDVPDDRFTRIYQPGEHIRSCYICEWVNRIE